MSLTVKVQWNKKRFPNDQETLMNIGSRTNLATELSTWPLSLKALIRMISMFEAQTTYENVRKPI